MLIIMTPVLCLPSYKSIAKISAIGTLLIVAIFIFIAGYGLALNGIKGLQIITWNDLFPRSFSAFSNWFGIMVCKFVSQVGGLYAISILPLCSWLWTRSLHFLSTGLYVRTNRNG
jgi:hypothetical protein